VQLIIAEKPSVARDLARVLGVRPQGQHDFEGDAWVITWCIGHLVELDEPAAYDSRWKAWRLDTLPMLPTEFRLRASKHAAPQLRAVAGLLRERRFTSVINACDAGREGELIFRYVYQYAGGGPPIRRLWISSLTDDAIKRGLAALRPGTQLEALGDAARSRSEADWLVGMNATRAITARGRDAGHEALYSIGRVQTPTLAMIVERERAIRAFVPRDYWEVRGAFRTADGQRFEAGWRHGKLARLATAPLAEEIVTRDRAHASAKAPLGPRVERVRARTVREPAPLLFDLTSLQRTANRRFGFSAARTLEIAQALYERHKLLTYPRTDSRHLSTDVVPELPALFTAIAELPDYAAFATPLLAQPPRPNRRIVDDTKVHDHHAIIPTGKGVRLEALDRDERRLFDLVVRRFLGAFYPDAELAVTEVWIRVGGPGAPPDARTEAGAGPRGGRGELEGPGGERDGSRGELERGRGESGGTRGPSERSNEHERDRSERDGGRGDDEPRRTDPRNSDAEVPLVRSLPPLPDRYLARGRVRIAAGWQEVAGIDGEDKRGDRGDREDDSSAVLPPLIEGQALDGAFKSMAKKTTPPARYTEASLLGAMESAGKAIDDEALRAAMKDCGLGTPATRAAIIETLLRRHYIERSKQQLVPTSLGINLIEALPVASLASPELTGSWEARLARIARGEESRAAFMADIARYVADMVDAVRGSTPPAAPDDAPPISPCPRCGSGVVPRPRAFACTGTCGFVMRNRVAGREITAALAGVLMSAKRSQVLGGFRSKAGKPFSAALILDDSGELRFDFSQGNEQDGAGSDRSDDDTQDAPGRSSLPRAASPRERKPRAMRTTRGTGATASQRPTDARASTTSDRRTRGAALQRTNAPRASTRADRPRQPRLQPDQLACPRCASGTLLAGNRGWGCTRWREGCRFVIWFETAGRRLTTVQLRDLVTRGKTRKSRFEPEDGREADGRLVLEPAVDGGARFEPA
jgi:DNA topoisomerase-3